jgi:hypothetical protein
MVVADDLVFTSQELAEFKNKSTERCPTFGCCPTCWSAGPVSDICNQCYQDPLYQGPPADSSRYKIVKVEQRGRVKWVDGRALATMFDLPVKDVMADYRVRWLHQPNIELTEQQFNTLVARKFDSARRKLFYL